MAHSLRKAINDKCKECNYDEFDRGNWRQQITSCTMTDCPLYPVRPLSSGKSVKANEKASDSSNTEIL